MKIRALHPEFFLDPDLCSLPYEARILFAGLWCHSDDYGRGRWLPKAIEGDVFPRDEVDIEALLSLLVEGGFIVRYTVPGKSGQDLFYFIPNWETYQTPKYRAKTSIPEPPPENRSTAGPGEVGTESGTLPGQSSPEFAPVEVEEVLEVEVIPSPNGGRPRNPWFDATCAALDMPPKGQHEGLIGAIAAKARNQGHPPEEIIRRAALHAATFNFPLTPGSLKKRWDELGSRVVTATPAERKTLQENLERMRQREQILAAAGGEL